MQTKNVTFNMERVKKALTENKLLFGLLLIASFLLFKNLDNIYLWQDEAETAVLAQNILEYGYPRAWDGNNIITQNAEKDFNEQYVWTWSPWLQLYITAGSFWLFGANTFSARLPFVLIGLASICFFYFFTRRISESDRVAQIASTLMITSIPFLLHARQCRWYMAAVFATIWMLYAYLKLQKQEKFAALHLTLSSILLFHSNFLAFFGILGGIILHYLYCHFRGLAKPLLKSMVIPILTSLLFIVPWIIYSKAWDKSNPFEEYALPVLSRILALFIKYLLFINSFFFPFVFLVGIVWIFLKRKKGDDNTTWENTVLILFPIVCTILFLSVMPWMYFRYLIALVPLCCLLLGFIINKIMDSSRIAAYSILLLLIFTNVFSLTMPPYQMRFDFFNYLYEITHDYDGPNEGIVNYLKKHGQADQFVITNYGQLPIMFYTNMRTIGFGQDLITTEKADWIIVRRRRGYQKYLQSLSTGYQAIRIDYPDIPWGNRPDPVYHQYQTVMKAPRIVIYKR
jgi:4-amino-4-deoxy-L-arabinose transferase-like glycosyltransferase